jgi:CheY-like chemotaxis protein
MPTHAGGGNCVDARTLRRVLLIENDPDIQLVVQMALESVGGFTGHDCNCGREALDATPDLRPGFMLLDIMMPEKDGPTTLQALRTFPELADPPVAFMTAKVQSVEVARYRSMGVADIIAKPFDPMALPESVRRTWVKHRKSYDPLNEHHVP